MPAPSQRAGGAGRVRRVPTWIGNTPGTFLPLVVPPDAAGDEPALVVSVRDRAVHIDAAPAPAGGLFLGTLDGRPCWAVEVEPTAAVDMDFTDLYLLWGAVGDPLWAIAGRAVQLVDWARSHRFCGRCAAPTEQASGERAMRCPSCGLMAFPRLAPAMIVLIERDDGRVLLARNVSFPMAMYSCLAGFVEPGETLEEAVRREVKEEVGVDVDGITYWGSQPWPFPHSLMLGFVARYAGGEICCAADEIADARWFAHDELPAVPPPISIARRLIDDWLARARQGGGRAAGTSP